MKRLALLLAALLALGVHLATPRPAQAASFTFNWLGAPSAPTPWTPGSVNDWDLITNNDSSTDDGGTLSTGHGSDCSVPPATHTTLHLVDTAFICNNHMMTAVCGGGDSCPDANVAYGAVYFTPAQLVDFSAGNATVKWSVSTKRTTGRDWWDVWITPLADNLVVPQLNLPAYNGPPENGLQIMMDNGACFGAGAGANPATIFRARTFASVPTPTDPNNINVTELGTNGVCVEDQLPGGATSAVTRSTFQLDITQTYFKFSFPATGAVFEDDNTINLPFTKALVQIGHHGYNPGKGCAPPITPTCQGNTWHWSDFSISPAVPFVMLRPSMPHSLHAGQNPTLTLLQPVSANAHLRFAALGNISVSLNGGAFQPAVKQRQDGPLTDGVIHPEQFQNYWMSIPAGTTSVAFSGTDDPSTPWHWWVEDVSVWAS